MRTTVNLPDALIEEAKAVCARDGRTLGDVIADGLRVVLFPSARKDRLRKVNLPTFRGSGLQPGVDLDHNAALLDRMDGE